MAYQVVLDNPLLCVCVVLTPSPPGTVIRCSNGSFRLFSHSKSRRWVREPTVTVSEVFREHVFRRLKSLVDMIFESEPRDLPPK